MAPGDKTPKTRIKRKVLNEHEQFIEQYRKEHPGVAKFTLKPAIDAYCQDIGIKIPSVNQLSAEPLKN